MSFDLDHRAVERYAYALIDPLRGEGQDAWTVFPHVRLVPSGFEKQANQFPLIVDLREKTAEQRNCLMALLLDELPAAGKALCVALLRTKADRRRLSRHIKHVMAPRLPDRQRRVFRFYDPIVFEHLHWMADPRTMTALLGPVDEWVVPLRGGWYTQTQFDKPRPTIWHFKMPIMMWQRIGRIGAIHAVLKQDPEWSQTPSNTGPLAEALLIRAEQEQLIDREDAIAYATHGLRWHCDVAIHPRIQQILAESRDYPGRYSRLTGRLGNEVWQAIVDELEVGIDPNTRYATSTGT